jgi:hypothetical protein
MEQQVGETYFEAASIRERRVLKKKEVEQRDSSDMDKVITEVIAKSAGMHIFFAPLNASGTAIPRGGIHQMFTKFFYDSSTIILRLFPACISLGRHSPNVSTMANRHWQCRDSGDSDILWSKRQQSGKDSVIKGQPLLLFM